jgi:hypothetical protein
MKNATLSLLAVTAVFAGTSIYLAVELGKTRDALAAETSARVALEMRARQPETQTFREVTAAQAVRQPAPTLGSAPPPSLPDAAPTANRPAGFKNDERATNDPKSAAMQRQRRLMQEAQLRQRYADMPGELGLDKAQANKLFDLLADSQVAADNGRRTYAEDPIGSRSLADAARQERDASITALLGPDKAAEFLTFEKSIGARMQVGRIDAQMTAADIPLRDDQRKAMIVEIAAEQVERPAPERDPTGSDADYQNRFLDWQAEYSKRVQARVEPLLTADQLARYREAVQVQDARRAQQRARAEQRRNAQQQP